MEGTEGKVETKTTTKRIPAEVQIREFHGRAFSSFYTEAATIDDCPINKIGRSETSPFIFYLFNSGKLVAEVDVQRAIMAAVADQEGRA